MRQDLMSDGNQGMLRFVFVAHQGKWNAPEGTRGQHDTSEVVRSMPGDIVACAPTRDEAEEKLQSLLEACFARVGSPTEWYMKAMARMDKEDLEEFKRLAGKLFAEPGSNVRSTKVGQNHSVNMLSLSQSYSSSDSSDSSSMLVAG